MRTLIKHKLNSIIPDSALKKEPHFWVGEIPKNIQGKFFLIRVSAVFFLKKGKKPFIDIHNSADFASRISNELAFKYYVENVDYQADNYTHKPVIITSSRFKNSKFYGRYKDKNGNSKFFKMTRLLKTTMNCSLIHMKCTR